MFDRVTVNEAFPYCREINTVEKRAPTDESVRLLKEMQEKATASILETLPLENNIVEATALKFAGVFDDELQIHMKVNGKTFISKMSMVELKRKTSDESQRYFKEQLLLPLLQSIRIDNLDKILPC